MRTPITSADVTAAPWTQLFLFLLPLSLLYIIQIPAIISAPFLECVIITRYLVLTLYVNAPISFPPPSQSPLQSKPIANLLSLSKCYFCDYVLFCSLGCPHSVDASAGFRGLRRLFHHPPPPFFSSVRNFLKAKCAYLMAQACLFIALSPSNYSLTQMCVCTISWFKCRFI